MPITDKLDLSDKEQQNFIKKLLEVIDAVGQKQEEYIAELVESFKKIAEHLDSASLSSILNRYELLLRKLFFPYQYVKDGDSYRESEKYAIYKEAKEKFQKSSLQEQQSKTALFLKTRQTILSLDTGLNPLYEESKKDNESGKDDEDDGKSDETKASYKVLIEELVAIHKSVANKHIKNIEEILKKNHENSGNSMLQSSEPSRKDKVEIETILNALTLLSLQNAELYLKIQFTEHISRNILYSHLLDADYIEEKVKLYQKKNPGATLEEAQVEVRRHACKEYQHIKSAVAYKEFIKNNFENNSAIIIKIMDLYYYSDEYARNFLEDIKPFDYLQLYSIKLFSEALKSYPNDSLLSAEKIEEWHDNAMSKIEGLHKLYKSYQHNVKKKFDSKTSPYFEKDGKDYPPLVSVNLRKMNDAIESVEPPLDFILCVGGSSSHEVSSTTQQTVATNFNLPFTGYAAGNDGVSDEENASVGDQVGEPFIDDQALKDLQKKIEEYRQVIDKKPSQLLEKYGYSPTKSHNEREVDNNLNSADITAKIEEYRQVIDKKPSQLSKQHEYSPTTSSDKQGDINNLNSVDIFEQKITGYRKVIDDSSNLSKLLKNRHSPTTSATLWDNAKRLSKIGERLTEWSEEIDELRQLIQNMSPNINASQGESSKSSVPSGTLQISDNTDNEITGDEFRTLLERPLTDISDDQNTQNRDTKNDNSGHFDPNLEHSMGFSFGEPNVGSKQEEEDKSLGFEDKEKEEFFSCSSGSFVPPSSGLNK